MAAKGIHGRMSTPDAKQPIANRLQLRQILTPWGNGEVRETEDEESTRLSELQRAQFHCVAETGSWSGTEEKMQAMRRAGFCESSSLRADDVARGSIPDCPHPDLVRIRCSRCCRRRSIYRVGRRALSALSRSTCRSGKTG